MRPSRARTAWPIRAWGIARRPAPSSTSSPAATAVSVASSRLVAVEPARGDEHRQRRRLAGDGGEVEHLRDDRVEAVEPQPDHRPDRLRAARRRVAPSVWRISSVRKKALPPVAACSSAASGVVAPVDPQQLADVVGGETVDDDPRQQPVAGEIGGAAVELRRSGRRPGTGPSPTTITRPGCSWRSTCSIIFSEGASAHWRSSSTISSGCSADSRAQHLGDASRTAGSARRSGSGRSSARLGDELLQLGEQQGEQATLGGHPAPGLGRDVRRTVRIASTIGSNGTIASARRPSPQHDGARAWASAANRAAEPGLAGAGLALTSSARWRAARRATPSQIRCSAASWLVAPDERRRAGPHGRAGQRHRATAGGSAPARRPARAAAAAGARPGASTGSPARRARDRG